MNILIVGLGYAGTRFLNAFQSLGTTRSGDELRVAYSSRRHTREDLVFFDNLQAALQQWQPAIVVVSVSDGAHAEILQQLEGYRGFVICEKPLVNAHDDLERVACQLKDVSGFCMDLVERYSEATESLQRHVRENGLSLIRAHFIWGKDRIHDSRPTCGVPSEIIHGLDLIEWVAASGHELTLSAAIGTRSDFSVSGDDVLDSAAITATLGDSLVSAYSSFVNIERQRTVDFVFASPSSQLIYARLVFDTPTWDVDSLRIWERRADGDHVISEFTTSFPDAPAHYATIQKLRRMVEDVVEFAACGTPPSRPFAGIAESIRLQTLLNAIESDARTIGPARYVIGGHRPVLTDSADLERLG